MENENSQDIGENLPVQDAGRDIIEQNGVVCANCGRAFSREKIFCPVCGLRYTEDAKLPSEVHAIHPAMEQATRSSRIFALLSLILGIAGPLALGVGWLLAIIFGLSALNIIRIRGGFSRDRKLAIWGTTLGFIWPIAIGFLILSLSYRKTNEKRIRQNETFITSDLKNIAVTQKYIKSGYFFDRDNDGESEYGDLEDLSLIDYLYFGYGTAPGEIHGYNIKMEIVKEKSFRITATPLKHGATGRRSFYIDETGILRAGDARREGPSRNLKTLPKVANKSVFEEFDDEIAGDLLTLAKKVTIDTNFQRARNILMEIKTNYSMSTAASKVKQATENMNAYMAEDKSRKSYKAAMKLMKANDNRKALTILKDIERDYPDTIILADVKKDRVRVEKALAEQLENEAKLFFAEAEKLEVVGKYDEALSKYKKIMKELDSTSYFPRAKKIIPVVEKKWEAKNAEMLFAHLSELKPAEKHDELISAIKTLTDHYSGTKLVKEKETHLASLTRTATGYREKKRAEKQFEKRNFRASAQAGEEALRASPGFREEINPILEASYLNLAENYFKSKHYREAAANYEKWIKLSPKKESPEYEHYIESMYQLGKSAYLTGNYKEAKKNFLAIRQHLDQKDEFWYFLGRMSIAEKNNAEAIKYLKRATLLNKQNYKAWYKLGLCRLSEMQAYEEKLPKEIEQLNTLKRGTDIAIQIATIINDLNAKQIDLGLKERPKILDLHTRLTLKQIREKKFIPIERAQCKTATRDKLLSIEKQFKKNETLRKSIVADLREIYGKISSGYHDMKEASLSNAIPELLELLPLTRKKMELLSSASSQLKPGLTREMHHEERAISCLKTAIYRFAKGQSLDYSVDEIDSLYDPFRKSRIDERISEGNKLLLEAISIKIPVENYITGAE